MTDTVCVRLVGENGYDYGEDWRAYWPIGGEYDEHRALHRCLMHLADQLREGVIPVLTPEHTIVFQRIKDQK